MFNLFLADEPTGCLSGNNLYITIPLFVLLIGFLIWSSISNKKKQKEAQNMVNTLKKGDRVKTIGGICGFVVEVYDAENTFVLETGTGDKKSYIKFDKAAIYQTAPKEGYANPKPNEEVKVEDKPEEKVEKPEETSKPAKKGKKSSKKATQEVEVKEEVKEETKDVETEVKPEDAPSAEVADKE